MSLAGAAVIAAVLTQDASVAALVAGRVYPDKMPQAPELPAIVFSRVSSVEGVLLDGQLEGLPTERWQLDVYGRSRGGDGGTWTVAEAVRRAFGAEIWPLDLPTVRGHAAFPAGARDFEEQDTRLLRTSLDYLVTFTRAI